MNDIIEDDILNNHDIDIDYVGFIDEDVIEKSIFILTLQNLFRIFLYMYKAIMYLRDFMA